MDFKYTLFVCFFIFCTGAYAKSPVWKVVNGQHVVYLTGTIHVLSKTTDFPLPKGFETAYKAADAIYFETDLYKLNEPKFIKTYQEGFKYKNGKTIASVLDPNTYQRLQNYLSQYHLRLIV